MFKMMMNLQENPNESFYEFNVGSNEIPKELKITTLKSMVENIIGDCEIKMSMKPRTGTLNFRIIKNIGVMN